MCYMYTTELSDGTVNSTLYSIITTYKSARSGKPNTPTRPKVKLNLQEQRHHTWSYPYLSERICNDVDESHEQRNC